MSRQTRLAFAILSLISCASVWRLSSLFVEFSEPSAAISLVFGNNSNVLENLKTDATISTVSTSHLEAIKLEPDSKKLGDSEWIMLNPNSTMASDVKSIWHDSSQGSITVELQETARCLNPSLRGRLSGPSLSILDWKQQLASTRVSSRWLLTGRYDVPRNGLYFIEIIVLYCRDIDETTDFKDVCLAPAEQFRLTAWNASIQVKNASGKVKQPVRGHWVNRAESSHVPMYTRFQPEGCRDETKHSDDFLAQHCLGPLDMTRFDPYEFKWPSDDNDSNVTAMLLQYLSNKTNQALPPTNLCFMGASHSIRIVKYLKRQTHLFPRRGSIQFSYVYVKFPSDIVKLKMHKLRPCSKVVLGIGQWPASTYGKMTIVQRYQDQLEKGLRHLQEIYPLHSNLFIRNFHYNPLGDVKLTCPPKDWRNPRVVDLYNEAHQRLARLLNITYIDTNFIMGPMWDQAADWCHYDGIVGVTEALYLAGRILGVIPF